MPILIRYAVPTDAPLIADLSRQTFYETYAAQNAKENMDLFMDEQFTREALMAEVSSSRNTFLLAEVRNEAVGYARLRDASPDPSEIEIARIYAITAMIGKGVGKALMHACLDVAKQKNKKAVWLGVWEKNARAIAFYTAWGFEKVAEHDFRLGKDVQRDWIMRRTV